MNEFEIVLTNNQSYYAEGILRKDKCDNELKISLKNYDNQLIDNIFNNNLSIKNIYGNFHDKKIILKSYYICELSKEHIDINVIIAIFYQGFENNYYKIENNFDNIDNVNIHYNFLNHIKNYEDLKIESLLLKDINNSRYINFKFNNNIDNNIDNIKFIHKKMSNIYKLITSKTLNINDLYLESKDGKYYVYYSNFKYDDKKNTIYGYENIIYNNFTYLINRLFSMDDKTSLFIDDFIAHINYRGLLENQIIILVSIIECFNSSNKIARIKIKYLLDTLPENIKEIILYGFEKNDLSSLGDENENTENNLLSIIINTRVYRTHGKDKGNVAKNLKMSLLVNKWLELIIQAFLLFELNLNNEELLSIVEKKIKEINNIKIIE